MQDLAYAMYIDASPQRVLEVLVAPGQPSPVFHGARLEFTLEVGSLCRYIASGVARPETVHLYGTMLECEPGRAFAHTVHVGEAYGPEHAAFESRVRYTLEPVGECTRLSVVHDRWMDGDPSYPRTGAGGWAAC